LDSAGVIWGIDHGLCFHEADKLRSVIWDWADEPIAEALLADVERTGRALEVCTPDSEPLLVLLTDKERQALISRIGRLLTRRRFPVPGAERHYPWPLV
ncbi:MAG TPA: phosphatidylinositol kinase, partial [Dehalococcoidia bacterium]|nr:phosphatidylinositol kinase [Dehalococcoidia bacterium]